MTDYQERVAKEAWLIILKELAIENSYSMNETLIMELLETFGINRDRTWVRKQLKALEALDAVTTRQAGTVMIAEITRKGLDHVRRKITIEGIPRPSPEV